MTFDTNSMTSANPAADLYTALASALSTAGFTLVDTVTISTRTHKVWKSAAAGNSMGLDWYLDVAYTTTGAGSVWLGAFEDYVAGTDTGYRGPYNAAGSSTPDATYFSRYGATGSALETNWTHISNNCGQVQTQTTAYAYWMSVTTDRVIMMTSVAPLNLTYCGFFDMYTPWANKIASAAYPLITALISSPAIINQGQHSAPSGSPQAALTRIPPVAASVNWAQVRVCCAWVDTINPLFTTGSVATLSSQVNGCAPGAPLGYVDSATVAYGDARYGGLLQIIGSYGTGGTELFTIGTLKDVAVFFGQAVTRGDTIAISGTDWVMSNQQVNRVYGFKAI